jgi:hypothetical protein
VAGRYPEGYYAGSPGIEKFIRWRMGGALLPVEQYIKERQRKDILQTVNKR